MHLLSFFVFFPFLVLACYLNQKTVFWLTKNGNWANNYYDEEFVNKLSEGKFLSKFFMTEIEFVEFLKPLNKILPESLMQISDRSDDKKEIKRELELISQLVENAIKTKKMDRDGLKQLYNAFFQHSLVCSGYYEENEDFEVLLNNVMDYLSLELQKSFSPRISTKPPTSAKSYYDFIRISLSNVRINHSKLDFLKINERNQQTKPYFYDPLIQFVFSEMRKRYNLSSLPASGKLKASSFITNLIDGHCSTYDSLKDDILTSLLNYDNLKAEAKNLKHTTDFPHQKFLKRLNISGLIIKVPMVPKDLTDKSLTRYLLLHIMMLFKQLSAQERRLKSYMFEPRMRKSFIGMFRNETKLIEEIAGLIITKNEAEKMGKFVQILIDQLKEYQHKLDKMPTPDVPSHPIEVSEYVKSFNPATFIPSYPYSKNVRVKRIFSKSIFDLVFKYFSYNEKPSLQDLGKEVEKVEKVMIQMMRFFPGPEMNLSYHTGALRVLGFILWSNDRLVDDSKDLNESGNLKASMLTELLSSEGELYSKQVKN
jgi:hypothetical protein